MGIISTGLGFTTDSGGLSQSFCLPANATTLSLDWNFVSEEFREYCGSIFQDYFRVELVTASGAQMLFQRTVDDVCGTTVSVPFSFDQGDAWATGWQSAAIDIASLAQANGGKNVKLVLSAGDVGDSIYDTAIVLDRIQVTAQ